MDKLQINVVSVDPSVDNSASNYTISKKRKMRLTLFCLVLVILFVSLALCKKDKKKKNNKSCNDNENKSKTISGKDLLQYLSSKGPYKFSGKEKTLAEDALPFPGCKAVQLWYFGRHGTRNPGKKDTAKMHQLLPIIKDRIIKAAENCSGSLSNDQLKKLKDWKLPSHVTAEAESNLVKQGTKELEGIGSRWRKRFPHLFSKDSYSKIRLKSTKSQRTEASALSFTHGALDLEKDEHPPSHLFATPQKSDPVLKFYENCKKWTEEVDENSDSTPELSEFEESEHINDTISRVSAKLRLNEQLSLEEITIIYTTCGFDTAWKDGKASPWCAAFEKEDLKVMAYREDLDYYWKDGYGYPVNYEQACVPFKDLLGFLGNSSATNVQAYFSHSGATLKLLARLGLFQDQVPLTSDKFPELKSVYRWQTSLIDSMATNMAFVIYDCEGKEEQEVGFFFQEIPTEIPACGFNWHCPISNFRTAMEQKIGSCDFNKICNV